jgi:hypothetical protein
VVAPGEPEWLPEDTEAALEWQDYQDTLCSGCGFPIAECFHPDMEEAYTAAGLTCHACSTRERAAKERAKHPNADLAGVFFTVTKEAPDPRG